MSIFLLCGNNVQVCAFYVEHSVTWGLTGFFAVYVLCHPHASTLIEYNTRSHNTYMCGDYNIDLLKINSVQFNENYFDSIISSGYVPTITLPSRLSDNSSLIDNVFTSNLKTHYLLIF